MDTMRAIEVLDKRRMKAWRQMTAQGGNYLGTDDYQQEHDMAEACSLAIGLLMADIDLKEQEERKSCWKFWAGFLLGVVASAVAWLW